MNPYMEKARYHEQVIPEYRGNPMIEALPEIWSGETVVEMLSEDAPYHDGERMLDAHYRMHCIQRLFHYFQPLEQHIDIEQRISRCIRQGYLNRNPLSQEYARTLADGYEALVGRKGYQSIQGFRPNASGFTIIGMSGVGKSTAVEKILSLYPQCIEHSCYCGQPLMVTQLVWLKLDCPHDGSIKGLCFQFFNAVDRTAGTDYFPRYTKARYTVDVLMVLMTQLVNLYQIGILIIDEIQHLSLAKGGGSEKMLNFFVTLVNTIGIPVVMIGTTKAMSILQSEFRQARRGSGQGDLLWDRMQNDLSWKVFTASMWRHQWTREKVALTGEIRDALYEESQGIIDIAVKLYAMVQVKAITTGKDTFGVKDFHTAAAEKLGLVKPMLDALRAGDKKKIQQYGDISPVSIEDYLSAYASAVKQPIPEKKAEEKVSVLEKAVLKLLELGVEPPVAKRLAGKVAASHDNKLDVTTVVKEAYYLYVMDGKEKMEDRDELDLREQDGYEELKEKGMVDGMEW
ncbi:Transposon Tn7 transposition protein TnsC [Eubacterium plexicaudatum ASF492]|uniref:ORC1/DEAH AAA+ ATPase domain-containing protein n=1 Tax=Eubacterium plexicaudatum ASF492 TaxID=1235802 RepID=N1ZT49_9FIRM|nr:Transposon Tn7 transposition protein TnsC [Eubacterium plexicaudatum ASF492]